MKNIIIKYILPIALVLTIGCTSDFEEVNTDPNSLTENQIDASIAGQSFANLLFKGINCASWALPGDDHGTYGLITMLHSMVFTHYLSAEWANTENYGLNDGWRDRGWLRFYTFAVPALRTTYQASEGNAEALAVLDIYKAFIFHRMTDHWGPIPYTEAGLGGASVAFDSQEDMYNDFFTLLESANATLAASSETSIELFAANDAVYGGDLEKWRRFGNSLRLRLALRISDVNPTKAQQEAEAAVAAGVIESNEGSAYYDTNADFFNNFSAIAPTWGFVMTASMESILEGYNDPRADVWFVPVDSTGDFIGRPSAGTFPNDTASVINSDVFGDSGSKDMEVMLASETYFNRAEGVLNGWDMGGETAQSYYEQGIRLSMEQWGVDASAIDAYIAGTTTASQPNLVQDYVDAGISTTPPVDVPVAFATSEADQRKQIAVQKYLGLFPLSWEAWADLRRTDAQILYPNIASDDANITAGTMIKRLTYLPNEYTTNRTALDAALNAYLPEGDKQSTALWWDVD